MDVIWDSSDCFFRTLQNCCSSLRHFTATILGNGIMVDDFRHDGTADCCVRLNTLVSTSASWSAYAFSTWPDTPPGPADLFAFTVIQCCPHLVMLQDQCWLSMLSGWQDEATSPPPWVSKQAKNWLWVSGQCPLMLTEMWLCTQSVPWYLSTRREGYIDKIIIKLLLYALLVSGFSLLDAFFWLLQISPPPPLHWRVTGSQIWKRHHTHLIKINKILFIMCQIRTKIASGCFIL